VCVCVAVSAVSRSGITKHLPEEYKAICVLYVWGRKCLVTCEDNCSFYEKGLRHYGGKQFASALCGKCTHTHTHTHSLVHEMGM